MTVYSKSKLCAKKSLVLQVIYTIIWYDKFIDYFFQNSIDIKKKTLMGLVYEIIIKDDAINQFSFWRSFWLFSNHNHSKLEIATWTDDVYLELKNFCE